MRIISGTKRGKKLLAPEGMDTRPTLDRVKQKMFDCIQFEVAGTTVLDLFAGSGQLGLEALSRGADFCVFNDKDRRAAAVVQKNIIACGFEKNAMLTCNLYTECVTICKGKGLTFSLVLLDPPYERGLTAAAMNALKYGGVLQPGALIVAEQSEGEERPEIEGFSLWKEKKSGQVSFCIYKWL